MIPALVLFYFPIVAILFTVLLMIYLYLFLRCGLKLRRLKKKYGAE